MNFRTWTIWTIGLTMVSLMTTGCHSSTPRSRTLSADASARNDQAMKDYSEAIRRNPDDSEAYFGRGFTYSLKGLHQEAIQDYTRCIELAPGNVNAYGNRGTEYYRLGQTAAAMEDFNKAIELKPDYALAYENRAWAYYTLKDYDKAWADVKACRDLGIDPDASLVSSLTRASGRSQ